MARIWHKSVFICWPTLVSFEQYNNDLIGLDTLQKYVATEQNSLPVVVWAMYGRVTYPSENWSVCLKQNKAFDHIEAIGVQQIGEGWVVCRCMDRIWQMVGMPQYVPRVIGEQ